MANENKCGYCREVGHQKRKCPMFHGQRAMIWNGTVEVRKKLHETLATVGVGNGAIISAHDYGELNNYLVLDHAEVVSEWQIYSFSNLKYSKQVKITRTEETDMFTLSLLNLRTSQATVRRFYHHYLTKGGWDEGYEGYGSFRLLSPSNDECEVADERFEQRVLIPKRLCFGTENTGGWAHSRMEKSLLIDPKTL